MKRIILIFLTVLSINAFISCDDTKENVDLELTIQEKIESLEKSQWLLEGFESNVMYTFVQGKRYTHYGTDGVFGEPIPGTIDYNSMDEFLFMDFNFDNSATYDLKFSCDDTIVAFLQNGERHSRLFRLGSTYEQCLN